MANPKFTSGAKLRPQHGAPDGVAAWVGCPTPTLCRVESASEINSSVCLRIAFAGAFYERGAAQLAVHEHASAHSASSFVLTLWYSRMTTLRDGLLRDFLMKSSDCIFI